LEKREYWIDGIVEYWKNGIMGEKGIGMVEYWNIGKMGILE